MAKHCEKCNQNYGDEEPVCPHCGIEAAEEEVLDIDWASLADEEETPGEPKHEPMHAIPAAKDETPSGIDVSEFLTVEDEAEIPMAGAVEEGILEIEEDIPMAGVVEEHPPAMPEAPPPREYRPATMIAKPEEQESVDLEIHTDAAPPESGVHVEAFAALEPSSAIDIDNLVVAEDASGIDLEALSAGDAGLSLHGSGSAVLGGGEQSEERTSPPPEAFPGRRRSEVVLGEPMGGIDASGSALDWGAAAIESDRRPPHPVTDSSEPTSGDLARSLLEDDVAAAVPTVEDSAVNLAAPSGVELSDDEEGVAARSSSKLNLDDDEEPTVAMGADDEKDESDDEKPAKKVAVKKPRYFRRWVGGSFLGGVTAAAACLGLWAYGIEPPSDWKMVKARPPVSRPTVQPRNNIPLGEKQPNPTPSKTAVVETPVTLDAGVQHLAYGQPDKALEILGKVDITPEVLTKKGEARWLSYVKQKVAKNEKLIATDPEVKAAVQDLTQANNAESLFWLGLIQENTGSVETARKTYQKGLSQYKDKRFQASLDRLDALTETRTTGVEAQSSSIGDEKEARTFLLLMTLLQAEKDSKAKNPKPAEGDDDLGDLAAPAVPKEKPSPRKNPAATPAMKEKASSVAAIPEPEEAGFDFWQAAKLAKNQDYSKAIEALGKAREEHLKRRFFRLGRDQNPLSDPKEDIFLHACDELVSAWKLREKILSGTNPEVTKGNPILAVDELVKARKAATDALGSVIERLRKEKDATASDPDVKDTVKAIDLLVEGKKKAESRVDAFRTALEEAKYVSADQADLLEGLKKLLQEKKDAGDAIAAAQNVLKADANSADSDLSKGIQKLMTARKAAEEKLKKVAEGLAAEELTIKEIAAKLAEAHYGPPGATNEDVVKEVDKALKDAHSPVVVSLAHVSENFASVGSRLGNRVARVYDFTSRLAASEARAARYQALLLQTRTPQQMLGVWLHLLQDTTRKDLTENAVMDALRVTREESGDGTTHAQALTVQGLALRNQGKYDEARRALSAALKAPVSPKDEGWRVLAQKTLNSLSDPQATYLPRAEELRAAGQWEEALAVANTGLQVFARDSKNGSRLLAFRSLLHLDLARAMAKGKLTSSDPHIAEARKDAQDAVSAGALAEGHYALGRVSEELSNWTEAQKHYREALAAHPANDRVGNRYRLALARILLLQTMPQAVPAGAGGAQTQGLQSKQSLTALIALMITYAIEPQSPPLTPELDEALKLADQAIKDGDETGHLLRAKILARKGLWTEALHEYVQGLKKLIPVEYANDLNYLIENHPAFRMPDHPRTPDVVVAEEHFAAGLGFFWAHKYADAEKEFYLSLKNHDQDARYYYFLGLSRSSLGKRDDALEAFRRGATAEKQGKPPSSLVSETLERVQGPSRRTLEQFRP